MSPLPFQLSYLHRPDIAHGGKVPDFQHDFKGGMEVPDIHSKLPFFGHKSKLYLAENLS